MRYIVFMIIGIVFGIIAFCAIGNVLPLNIALFGGVFVCATIITLCLWADAAIAHDQRRG